MRIIEGENILDSDLSMDAQLLFVVTGLMCNEVGVAKQQAVTDGMQSPRVLKAAHEILDKARRRHSARTNR